MKHAVRAPPRAENRGTATTTPHTQPCQSSTEPDDHEQSPDAPQVSRCAA
jgi:hypothetical protein